MKITINFIHPDGKEDFEILEDLWASARMARHYMPKYKDIKIKSVESEEAR